MTRATAAILGTRALNRALLERQQLLRRRKRTAESTIEHLIGLQAQNPPSPYYALWSRLHQFRVEELSTLFEERKVVRIALMRSTIHVVTARDCLALRPAVQSVSTKSFTANHGRRLPGFATEAVAPLGRSLMEEKPRTFAELRVLLGAQWPGHDAEALAQAVRTELALVQVPPRGIWGRSGPIAHTTAEHWLGRPLSADATPDAMIVRYLAAFGPASVADVRTWSGLTGLTDAMERLRPGLITFRDEKGRELFDLPNAPRPRADTPAPPRYLPDYDNVFLAHADRTRIVSAKHSIGVATPGAEILGPFLVDGFIRGTWKIAREKRAATLEIRPSTKLAKTDRDALSEEGMALLSFAAGDAESYDVRVQKVVS